MSSPTPRVELDKSSVEYAGRTVAYLRVSWENLHSSFPHIKGILTELEECRAWERLGADSLDSLCKRELGVNVREVLEVVDGRIAATANGRVLGAAERTTGDVLPADGYKAPDNHGFAICEPVKESQAERAKANGVSKRTQEKLDALARQDSAQLERIKEGKVSVHRACIESGIIKEPSPLEQIKRLWKKLKPEERKAFLADIKE